MSIDPLAALQAASRPPVLPVRTEANALLIAGAAGSLGGAVLESALAGSARVQVLTTGPLQTSLRGLQPLDWLAAKSGTTPLASTALVVFDRARSRHGREDAFFQPEPGQLPELARWLRDGGVEHLALVLPHAPAMLPEALRHGLATLDEQAVAALGFTRLLIVRPTQLATPSAANGVPLLQRLANWCLSQLALMLPPSERPVRAPVVAAFVLEVLRQWPRDEAGSRVAGPEWMWAAAQEEGPASAAARWLQQH